MYFLLKISLFLLFFSSSCKKEIASTAHEAVFGGGCFWVLDYYFEKLDGVIDCKCIYTASGSEAVLIKYDPQKVTYTKLCNLFFELHNPASDFKAQYKSIIQVDSEGKRLAANKVIKSLKNTVEVKTLVESMGKYTFPDPMHEDWHKKKRSLPKCSIPKNSILQSLQEN